ncbi:hypothetical protein K491DRAFT_695618 [Lophiostoma macrostomum CBS 122681]|uniref:BYS1 domain protein n=1 Tax=Lophiostoma macrostomum CBS 122681 TaxID=1314788 RepID=A0A6A6SXC3_9PLEO|nr:hypothetical protein K491DRAFT_695618 [Lophiostoma macrostomum CBS 122681]
MRYTIPVVLALASSVSAVGNAVVKNKCSFPFYVWSVGASVGARQTVNANGGNYSEVLHSDATTGGISLKITLANDGLYTGAPEQIISYTLDGAQVWYDLSTVFGEPFNGKHITVTSKDGPTIDWPTGSHPAGSQVRVSSSGNDVVFTACA